MVHRTWDSKNILTREEFMSLPRMFHFYSTYVPLELASYHTNLCLVRWCSTSIERYTTMCVNSPFDDKSLTIFCQKTIGIVRQVKYLITRPSTPT